MTESIVATPKHLWAVGIVALLFNAIGVFDFVMYSVQGADYLASAGMTEEQVAHYLALPAWMLVVWAIGVLGAFLASILLLMKRKAAFVIFMVSLTAFVINLIHMYLLSDGGRIMGVEMAMTSAVIAALLIFFSGYSRVMSARQVLR